MKQKYEPHNPPREFITCLSCGREAGIFYWDKAEHLRMALCDNIRCRYYRHPINPDYAITEKDWGINATT